MRWMVLLVACFVGCAGHEAAPSKTEKTEKSGPSHDAVQNRQINRNDMRIEVLEAQVARLAKAGGVELEKLPVEPVANDGPLPVGVWSCSFDPDSDAPSVTTQYLLSIGKGCNNRPWPSFAWSDNADEQYWLYCEEGWRIERLGENSIRVEFCIPEGMAHAGAVIDVCTITATSEDGKTAVDVDGTAGRRARSHEDTKWGPEISKSPNP